MDYECFFDPLQRCWIAFLPGTKTATTHPTNADKAIETLQRIQQGEFKHMEWRTIPRVTIDVRA